MNTPQRNNAIQNKQNKITNRQRAQNQARNTVQPIVVRPPGQGLSRSAKQRRARREAAQAIGKNGSFNRPTSRSNFQRNAYLASLLDPKHGIGARIPDIDCQESGTFQIYKDLTLTVGASPADAVGVIWYPRATAGSYSLGSTTTAGGDFTWAALANMPSNTSVGAIYDSLRLVSAEIDCEFIGSTANNQGLIIGGCLPGAEASATGKLLTQASWFDAPTFDYFPLRNGIRVIYKPTDNWDFEYLNSADTAAQMQTAHGRYPAALCLAVQGAVSATSVCKVRLTANFEAIATIASTNFIDSAPSASNSGWMDSAMNTMNSIRTASSFVSSAAPLAAVVGSAYAAQMGRRGNVAPGYF